MKVNMKRLFVAVPVSEEIKDGIKQVIEELPKTGADLKLVSLSHLHFTLKFLGEIDEKKILEIEKRLADLVEKTKPFEISIKKVGVFPSSERINVVWIGAENPNLVSLMKSVSKDLDFIRKDDHQDEVAHLTIARVKSAKNKKEIQEFVKRFEKKDFGKMMVDRLILYESELAREGPVYRVVKEWELGKNGISIKS